MQLRFTNYVRPTLRWLFVWPLLAAGLIVLCGPISPGAPATALAAADTDTFNESARPLLQTYCLSCHSAAKHKGSLDLERFTSREDLRKDIKPWQTVAEMLAADEMPPKGKPQPTPAEREQLLNWISRFLNDEAAARAGDPGFVPTRRLSNAEYDATVRDLTGIDLRPAQEFPADGAGGEGFTNAAESLSDVSPALLSKYLLAAKEVAAHATLLPDGFRFSGTKTNRDWSNESVARLRAFYAQFTPDGRLPLEPYIAATLRHRDDLRAGRITPNDAAAKEHLNAKYFRTLWHMLNDDDRSMPMDAIRGHWRVATIVDAGKIAAEITGWQDQLWKVVSVGSYRAGNDTRQSAVDPLVGDGQTVRLALQSGNGVDATAYLSARNVLPGAGGGQVIWSNLRLEAAGKPTLALRDYAKFGTAYEYDAATVFGNAARYLADVAEVAADAKLTADDIARRDGLNAALLARWSELLALKPIDKQRIDNIATERMVKATPLETFDQSFKNPDRAAISGWRSKDAELPALLSNSSDVEEHIPGLSSPHKVVVHPSPTQFVAVVWTSSINGNVRVGGNVAHVHPNCGNGVAWWLEHRHGDRAGVLAEGLVDLGKSADVPAKDLPVAKGDLLILAVDAKNGDHSCDLTRIDFTVTEVGGAGRKWDLAGDVANSILKGNPHADSLGNVDVWRFVKGPTRPVGGGKSDDQPIPEGSLLAKWRAAVVDPAQQKEAPRLAAQVQALLAGTPPADPKNADRILYDNLAIGDGALLHGLDLAAMSGPATHRSDYGVISAKFGVDSEGHPIDGASIAAAVGTPIEVHLPAGLAHGRTLVVDAKLATGESAGDCAVQFSIAALPIPADQTWDGKTPLAALPGGAAAKKLAKGFDAFRQCFPLFTCYPNVIPLDEVVCLKMYHREDEPLIRLFLDDAQHREIDRLWQDHRFLSKWPVAENKYLPLFIGFVTQDQSKEMLAYFESQRPVFAKRADDFNHDWEAAGAAQLQQLMDFASRAYRRPLSDDERGGLMALYQSLRGKGVAHEEAFRGTMVRVLLAPSFLFRLEHAPAGKEAGAINDWELATRLSYFLWSSQPDDELRKAAAAGQLHDPDMLAAQVRRMLKDDRVRALAIEFGTQWLHVRGFDQSVEKSEKLYPTFDRSLRGDINEESILFFKDLFQRDRPLHNLLDADYAYLNESLARHYGIPGVLGPQWRKVDGVGKFGRGGVLGLASVQAAQAGASRTSPVLRGNWVVETLLGEKLPRPPPNVPKLPDEEGANNSLTTRQLVEKHVQDASCAACHSRMDPFGFAFEKFDAIGRLRDKETSGLPIDCRAKLKDGTEFEGIGGLRTYLLTKKKDVIVRLFCRRLLGYALGRSTVLSDQPLITQMAATMVRDDEPTFSAVLAIVRSPQFQRIRGSAFVEDQ